MFWSMAREGEHSWRRWGAVVAHINRAHELGGWQPHCTPSSVCTGGCYSLGDQKELCKSPVQDKGLCHDSGPVGSSVFLSVLGSCVIFSPSDLCSTGCSHKTPDRILIHTQDQRSLQRGLCCLFVLQPWALCKYRTTLEHSEPLPAIPAIRWSN